MKKFNLNQILVHLFIIVSSCIFVRHVTNVANTYPKGDPLNLYGNLLGLTLSFAVVVYIIVLFIPKNKKP